jgi:hypothetical protein
MSTSLWPVPPGMDASYDHDGAHWRFGGSVLAVLVSVLVGLVALGAGVAFGGWVWALVGLVWLVALLVLAQSLPSTRVQVTMRAVIVEHRSLSGLTRQVVRLDDITQQVVASTTSGDSALVLRTRDETVVIGSGCDPQHLTWFCQMVEHARILISVREQREGREWTFLRKAPEEIDQLRGN